MAPANFVIKADANALNSRLCNENLTVLPTATVRYVEVRFPKLLRSYPEAVNYPLKKFTKNAAIAKYNVTILRYMQRALKTTQRFADD